MRCVLFVLYVLKILEKTIFQSIFFIAYMGINENDNLL